MPIHRPIFSLLAAAVFLSGCQWLAAPVSVQELQTLTSEQNEHLARLLQAQEARLQASLTDQQAAQAQTLSSLQQQLTRLQTEVTRLQRQHSYQLSELAHQLDALRQPGFNQAPLTEVVRDDGKLLLGRYEWIALPNERLILPARIDSGANTSSLHAENLQEFERDGKTWLSFQTYQLDGEGAEPKAVTIEAPLTRRVRILQATGTESRPVVSLFVRLGSIAQETEFTLTDRGEMRFPALLGRRFMMDMAVIDISQDYVQGRPELPPLQEATLPQTADAEANSATPASEATETDTETAETPEDTTP